MFVSHARIPNNFNTADTYSPEAMVMECGEEEDSRRMSKKRIKDL